jgi:tagaturonate reductase
MLIRHNPEAQWVLFGGGNFQLAFTGWLLDQLADGTQRQRCILVRPTDGGIYEDLEKARGKYRCLLRGMKTGQPHQSVHQLDRIDRIVYPWEDFADYLDSALLPNLRFVVSNTTEAGLQVEQEPYRP